MSDQHKYVMGEDRIPHAWYNLVADLPAPPPPVLHPGTGQPIGPADLAPLFPMALIGQEVSAERHIEIPGPVRDIYRHVAPDPALSRARAGKDARHPARIYYKYEGVSPAGSHKPNTAVAQAYYNKAEGVKKLSTETGAGQWGSALAFAGALFGLEVKVYMVRVSYNQKPYRRALMETYGAQCVPSPSTETESGRGILAEHPDSPAASASRSREAVEVAAKNDDTEICARQRAQSRAPASDGDRPGSDRADGDGGRLSRHHRRLHGRRLEFRRHRVSVPRREAAATSESADHGGRARGLSVADRAANTPMISATPAI